MNAQKKNETRAASWKRQETKKIAVAKRVTFEGRARMRNSLAAELFGNDKTPEIEDLDFRMF